MCVSNTLKGRYEKKGKKIKVIKCQMNWAHRLKQQKETHNQHIYNSVRDLIRKQPPSHVRHSQATNIVSTDSPGFTGGRKGAGPKVKIVFTDLLAFQCHHHRETDSAFWIQPAVLALHFCCFTQGFFSPKKRLFQSIWNTRDSEQKGRLPINFYHNSSFWRQVFLPSTETPSFNESH